jgi:hypothetical protein
MTTMNISLPDSKLVHEAMAISAAAQSAPYMHHSLRVFVLAREVARKKELVFDEEGLLVAALFHDLGLSPTYGDAKQAFPEVGATLLYDFLVAREGETRAARLADAVDSNMRPFTPWRRGVEAGLLQVGNVIDAFGLKKRLVGKDFIHEVELAFPRLGLDKEGRRAFRASIGSFRSVARLVFPRRSRLPTLCEQSELAAMSQP